MKCANCREGYVMANGTCAVCEFRNTPSARAEMKLIRAREGCESMSRIIACDNTIQGGAR